MRWREGIGTCMNAWSLHPPIMIMIFHPRTEPGLSSDHRLTKSDHACVLLVPRRPLLQDRTDSVPPDSPPGGHHQLGLVREFSLRQAPIPPASCALHAPARLALVPDSPPAGGHHQLGQLRGFSLRQAPPASPCIMCAGRATRPTCCRQSHRFQRPRCT